jgi:putative protease
MPTGKVQTIELLAPARNADTAIAAIDHGADAVYMGASSHGARRQAANSVAEIASVVEYAHRFDARVYVTVNTIIYDDELSDVEALVWELYRVGVDALIVQDMALLKMNLPPIALHASTQCDIRTPQKARFLQDAGFSQLVLPRELTLSEIAEFRKATTVPLEAFVHGALCVSYSGDCQASFLLTGRSANRGDCAQVCRFLYDLEDANGNKLVRSKHLLSLKDMNRVDSLAEMLEAGVSSFKIEGRLKDDNYVRNVVAAYSQALNAIVAAHPDRYKRVSRGSVDYAFKPDLLKSFNRGYTEYFLHHTRPSGSMASIDSPKWIGERVGKVVSQPGKREVIATLYAPLANGDGLGYFDRSGAFQGFRLNRVDGRKLYCATEVNLPHGAELYRNYDKAWADKMEAKTARCTVELAFRLRTAHGSVVLDATDADGVSVSVATDFDAFPADKPQGETRRRTLAKLGDTCFSFGTLTDEVENLFIPASVLTQLRRNAVEAMMATYRSRHTTDLRRTPSPDLSLPVTKVFTRHDNIANHLAEEFYRGLRPDVAAMPKAVEVVGKALGDFRVMQTRYCLRRELGACLKTKEGRNLPSPLFLTSAGNRFRLDFDCAACCMSVIKPE